MWKERCRALFDKDSPKPRMVLVKLFRGTCEYWSSKRKNLVGASTPFGRDRERWAKPAQGYMKINCDAAFDVESGVAGLGIVARDSNGSLTGVTLFHLLGSSVDSLDALAILEGVRLAKSSARLLAKGESGTVEISK